MSANPLKEKFAEAAKKSAGNPAKPYKVLTILQGTRQIIQVKGQTEAKARADFAKSYPGAQIVTISKV